MSIYDRDLAKVYDALRADGRSGATPQWESDSMLRSAWDNIIRAVDRRAPQNTAAAEEDLRAIDNVLKTNQSGSSPRIDTDPEVQSSWSRISAALA